MKTHFRKLLANKSKLKTITEICNRSLVNTFRQKFEILVTFRIYFIWNTMNEKCLIFPKFLPANKKKRCVPSSKSIGKQLNYRIPANIFGLEEIVFIILKFILLDIQTQCFNFPVNQISKRWLVDRFLDCKW